MTAVYPSEKGLSRSRTCGARSSGVSRSERGALSGSGIPSCSGVARDERSNSICIILKIIVWEYR